MSFPDLEEKYGISANTIRQRAFRQQWKPPARQVVEKAMEAIMPRRESIEATREKVTETATRLVQQAIGELVQQSVTDARRIMERGMEEVESSKSARALRDAAGAWEVGVKHARLALGLDSPIAQSDQSWGGRRGVNLTIDLAGEDVIVTNPEQSSVREHDSESGTPPADGPTPT